MSVSAEAILARLKYLSSLRKWKITAYILALILVLSFYVNMVEKTPSKSYVARVEINGVILEDLERDAKFAEIKKNDEIKAVILHINSPGGGLVGAENIYEVFKDISSTKPVVVTMGTVAASAAYYIALAGEQIFARKGTLTGSIGVILQTVEVTELAEKLGIKLLNFKSSPFKAMPNPMEKMTAETNQYLQETIEDNYRIFYELVKERRKIADSELKKIANGRIYTGTQSVKNKLIDAIGGEKEALEWLSKNKNIESDIKVKKYENHKQKAFIKKILGKIDLYEHFFSDKIENVGFLSIWNL